MGHLTSNQDIVTGRSRALALKQEHDNSTPQRIRVAARRTIQGELRQLGIPPLPREAIIRAKAVRSYPPICGRGGGHWNCGSSNSSTMKASFAVAIPMRAC